MTKLLMIREQLRQIYAVKGTYIRPAINFVIMLFIMILINVNVGAMELLKNPAIVIVLSIIGAFLPIKMLTIFVMLVIIGHMTAISVEVAAFVFMVVLVMYLLFFRFTPKDSVVLLLIPILFFAKIPYVVPLVVGMVSTPISIISVSFGVVLYFMLAHMGANLESIMAAAQTDGFGQMTQIATSVFTSKALYLTIIAFALVVIVVYFVKRMSIDYSWIIAVIAGGVLCIVIMLIGALMFDMKNIVSVVEIIVGGIISTLLATVVRFFVHAVDYQRTEYVQFEDDEFFYYVKAVPKIKIATQEVNVKRINARKIKQK